MSQRIKALCLLGGSLVVTLLRYWFWRRAGLERFRANYSADRLLLLSQEEQEQAVTFARCIACGLCDRGEAPRIAQSNGEYPGLMPLVLNSLRNSADLRAAQRSWAHLPDAVLEVKEAICPTGVPFRRMKQYVQHKALELQNLGDPS